MSKLINDAFNCRNSNYIEVNNNFETWSNNANTERHCLTNQQVLDLFNFLIDNIYVQIGLAVFKEVIGIPMGTDCAPLIADFSLSFWV